MYQKLGNTIARRPRPRERVITLGPWPDGVSTEVQPEQMRDTQLSAGLNVILLKNGYLRTRDGSSLVASGMSGNPVQCDDVKVGSTWYEPIAADDDNKLYKNVSGTATAIATLDGPPRFTPFMGRLILTDTGYLKEWDGTSVKLLYDNGTGSTAYQVNKRSLTADDAEDVSLYATSAGGTTSVTLDFTTQDWSGSTAGTYTTTIPMTAMYANAYKVGSPTGNITASIETTAGVECASVDFTTAASALPTTSGGSTTGLEIEALFTASDITTEFSPDTSYKARITYSGGDALNKVVIKHIAASEPQVSVKPGKPPKAEFAVVSKEKLYAIEGLTGTNPSYVWYCARGNQLDWSTAGAGGYVAAVDKSATGYPIAAIASWNQSIWVWGEARQPFLGQLTGATPTDYIIADTKQKVSADYKSVSVTPDDIFFLSPSGVQSLVSIQEYAEIGLNNQTEDIRKTIHDYFSTAAVAGYDPVWGLYVVKLAGSNDIVVINTNAKGVRYKGRRAYSFSPGTFWRYNFGSEAVSCFGRGEGFMYACTDAGKVYKMDPAATAAKDAGNAPTYKINSHYMSTIFGEAQAWKIALNGFGKTGGEMTVKFYRNGYRTSFFSFSKTLPVDSTLLTVDADMLTTDADFLSNPGIYFDRRKLNFNFRTLMIGIEDITVVDEPVYFGPITLLTRSIGGL